MRLLPFTLYETSAYLKTRSVNLDQYQILQVYMALGGIPNYLKEIKKGELPLRSLIGCASPKMGYWLMNLKIFTALCSKWLIGILQLLKHL